MTNIKYCGIVTTESKNNYFLERNWNMKTFTSAVFTMCEYMAEFFYEECSFGTCAHIRISRTKGT